MASTEAQWAEVVGEVEQALQNTATDVGETVDALKGAADLLNLMGSMDALFDEIKSGDVPPSSELVLRIATIFEKLLGFRKRWHILQYSMLALALLLRHEELKAILAPSFVSTAQKLFLDYIVYDKREVRNAASQALGDLVGTYGDLVLTKNFVEALKNGGKVKDNVYHREGFMTAHGYVLKNVGSSASTDTVRELVMTVLENVQCFDFSAEYSRYVRYRALRALSRSIQHVVTRGDASCNYSAVLKEPEVSAALRAAVQKALCDTHIDVRKGAGEVFTIFTRFEAMHAANGESGTYEAGLHVLKGKLHEHLAAENGTLDHFGRHGYSNALWSFANYAKTYEGAMGAARRVLAKEIEQESSEGLVAVLLSTLKDDRQPPAKGDTSSANAAAAAGLALVEAVKCVMGRSTAASPGSDAVDALADRIESLQLVACGSAACITEKTLEAVQLMVRSSEPLLLDAGNQSIHSLFSYVLTHDQVSDEWLNCVAWVYKNRYHPSMPVRDSALLAWRSAHLLFSSEEFTEKLAPFVREMLVSQSTVASVDIRETVFKSIAEFVSDPKTVQYTVDADDVRSNVFTLCIEGMENKTGGPTSEYPRAAAVRALASLAQSVFRSSASFTPAEDKKLVKTCSKLLTQDESELMLLESLHLVHAMAHHNTKLFVAEGGAFAAATLRCCFSSHDSIRVLASASAASILLRKGDGGVEFFTDTGVTLSTLMNSLVLIEDEDAEEDVRIAVGKAVLALIPSVCRSEDAAAITAALRRVFGMLLVEANGDCAMLFALGIVGLAALLRSAVVRKVLSSPPTAKHGKLFQKCLRYALQLLAFHCHTSAVDEFPFDQDGDFEFVDEWDELAGDEGDASDSDSEDGDDSDSEDGDAGDDSKLFALLKGVDEEEQDDAAFGRKLAAICPLVGELASAISGDTSAIINAFHSAVLKARMSSDCFAVRVALAHVVSAWASQPEVAGTDAYSALVKASKDLYGLCGDKAVVADAVGGASDSDADDSDSDSEEEDDEDEAEDDDELEFDDFVEKSGKLRELLKGFHDASACTASGETTGILSTCSTLLKKYANSARSSDQYLTALTLSVLGAAVSDSADVDEDAAAAALSVILSGTFATEAMFFEEDDDDVAFPFAQSFASELGVEHGMAPCPLSAGFVVPALHGAVQRLAVVLGAETVAQRWMEAAQKATAASDMEGLVRLGSVAAVVPMSASAGAVSFQCCVAAHKTFVTETALKKTDEALRAAHVMWTFARSATIFSSMLDGDSLSAMLEWCDDGALAKVHGGVVLTQWLEQLLPVLEEKGFPTAEAVELSLALLTDEDVGTGFPLKISTAVGAAKDLTIDIQGLPGVLAHMWSTKH